MRAARPQTRALKGLPQPRPTISGACPSCAGPTGSGEIRCGVAFCTSRLANFSLVSCHAPSLAIEKFLLRPWSHSDLGHTQTLVTLRPWSHSEIDHTQRLITLRPWSHSDLGHTQTLITLRPWSHSDLGHTQTLVTLRDWWTQIKLDATSTACHGLWATRAIQTTASMCFQEASCQEPRSTAILALARSGVL
jgi:hypothetical protein